MERGPIVSEYFKLRDYLNRANKLSNQTTKIDFKISELQLLQYKFFAVSVGADESHRIALAERTAAKTWERTGHTAFSKLEEFCAQSLNDFEKEFALSVRPRKLSDDTSQRMARGISIRLQMLLINKSYEP